MNNEVIKRYNQQKYLRDNIHKAMKSKIENKSKTFGVIDAVKSIYKIKKLDKSIDKLGNQYKPYKRKPPKNSYKGYN
tara:strand:+ start:316 stop:546 length:231 start_codon:yes stop_codon:yes gene_type:complete